MSENIQKFNEAVKDNEELQKKLAAVTDAPGLDTFLAEAGLTLSAEEKTVLLAIFTARAGGSKLSEDELEDVAGGMFSGPPEEKCQVCGKMVLQMMVHNGVCIMCEIEQTPPISADPFQPGPCPKAHQCNSGCFYYGKPDKCVAGVIQ